jgi:transcriptional regulator with XRE-family HTH domain
MATKKAAKKVPGSPGAVEAEAFLAKRRGPLTLGRALAAIRQGEEESLETFAKRLGVSRQNLHDIEAGRRSVSLERAAEWARLLGRHERVFVELALQALVDEAGLKLRVTVRAA